MSFGSGSSNNKTASSEINVTPLIDIVLVLLIIFMVMTPVMLKELAAAVPRKATEAAAAPPGTPPPPILVRLDAAGALSVSGESIAPEALAARVAERLLHDRKKIVFFDVDDAANYGRAVQLMDICKGAGAKVLGIVTKD